MLWRSSWLFARPTSELQRSRRWPETSMLNKLRAMHSTRLNSAEPAFLSMPALKIRYSANIRAQHGFMAAMDSEITIIRRHVKLRARCTPDAIIEAVETNPGIVVVTL